MAAPTPPGSSPPAETSPGLTPSGRGARFYSASAGADDRGAAPPDPLRIEIIDDARVLARKAKLPAPEADARLDQAMYDLAHNLRGDDIPALEVVDFLLAHYGIAEPSPHILMARATIGGDRQIREHTAGDVAEIYRSGAIGRIGVGVDRDKEYVYVVVGLQERHLELSPVPRHLPRGGATPIAGKLESRFHDPRLVITAPSGAVTEQEAPLHAGTFRGELRCAGDGAHQVEVTAVGAMGIAVLANFPVYCGVAPPAAASRRAGVQPPSADPGQAEKQMLALVNRDRASARVPPAALDARLAEVARAYSREMAEHDQVSHVSPRTGTTLDRVRRGGLDPELVLENVGRAYSVEEAESGFMASPGHRGNIVDPRARRVGIGIAFGKPVTGTRPMFVTQLFMN